ASSTTPALGTETYFWDCLGANPFQPLPDDTLPGCQPVRRARDPSGDARDWGDPSLAAGLVRPAEPCRGPRLEPGFANRLPACLADTVGPRRQALERPVDIGDLGRHTDEDGEVLGPLERL